MPTLDDEKLIAARAAVEMIADGMTIGLGTGSTAAHVVRLLGAKLRSGFRVRAIPTSVRTEELARQEGIPLIGFEQATTLDLCIDGADEVDRGFQLIKGGGGALLRERIVASASARFIIVGDSSKRVEVLGRFPLPVEVLKFASPLVAQRVEALGARVVLRRGAGGEPYLTDERNYILDCHFERIENPTELARTLRGLPGVVDQGLFIDYPDVVLFGVGDAVERHDVVRHRPRGSP